MFRSRKTGRGADSSRGIGTLLRSRSNFERVEPSLWNVYDVGDWLVSIDMEEIKDLFINQGIDGEALLTLTYDDLVELGVEKLGYRKKIIRKISAINGVELGASSTVNDAGSSETLNSASASSVARNIKLRCYYKDSVFKTRLNEYETFRSLRHELEKRFNKKLRIKYRDIQGNMVEIRRESTFVECQRNSQSYGVKRVIFYLTEREAKNKEESNKERNEVFSFFDCILDALIIINELGVIKYTNSKAEELFGYTKGELLNKNVDILTTDDVRPYHTQYISNYLRTKVSKIVGTGRDVIAVTKCGTIIPIHLELSEKISGDKLYFFGLIKKVLPKANPKSLLQQEREVLDGLIVPSIIINTNGKIHGFNKAAQNLLGYTLLEVIDKNVNIFMTGRDQEMHDNYLANYLKTGERKIIGIGRSVVVQCKDGTLHNVFLTVIEKNGENVHFFTGLLQAIEDLNPKTGVPKSDPPKTQSGTSNVSK